MEKSQIFDKLTNIIKPYVNDQEAMAGLNEDSDLLRDLKINSAHLIDIVLDVESEFEVEIDDESMEKMVTIKDAVTIIQERIKE